MWRASKTFLRLTPPGLMGILPVSMYDYDNDKPFPRTEYIQKPDDTGWDRLKAVFRIDEYGKISPQMVVSTQAGYMGVFLGIMYGGVLSARNAYEHFMINNEHMIFKSPLEAKRQLQDKVAIAFGKGGLRWGWRIGIFTSSFVFVSSAVACYRGKDSWIEYTIGGFVSGFIYKINLGLAASFVGGLLGAVLGTIGGILTVLLLKISHTSVDDITTTLVKVASSRNEGREILLEKCAVEKESVFTEIHERNVGTNKDLNLLNEPFINKDNNDDNSTNSNINQNKDQ